MKQKFRVKNKLNSPRGFIDSHTGQYVVLEAGKSTVTTSPPQDNIIFDVKPIDEIESVEEPEKKDIQKTKKERR